MSARSPVIPKSAKPFPIHLTYAGMEKMRRMVVLGHSNREIAAAFGTQTATMDFFLSSRREAWLAAFREGRVDFLPSKTVVYRKVSRMNGDVAIRPFSVAPVTLHRQQLAEADL